ncbi:MAG: flagellin [Candidatus Thermoplasmatota archaeon]
MQASIGVGSLIIFIAMILVAGITASVLIQTMNSLEQQALKTGMETIREISSGLKVTHISGYQRNATISQLAIFITPVTGSEAIDLTYTHVSISDSKKQVILNYSKTCFSRNVTNGLFNTLNASRLSASTFGIVVIRDIDGSCNASLPIINQEDLVVLLINTSKCFSGLGTRIKVQGSINPEFGIAGLIEFTTPNTYLKNIVELWP